MAFRTAVTKEDIQTHFKEGSGTITEIKLMNGFGFIEYDDAMDARDVVPGKFRISTIPLYHPGNLYTNGEIAYRECTTTAHEEPPILILMTHCLTRWI